MKYIAFLIILLCSSCSQTLEEKIIDIQLNGLDLVEEIRPENVKRIFKSDQAKIVTFIDGRCNLCLDALRVWNNLLADTTCDSIPIIYYIGANNKESIFVWDRLYKLENCVIDKHKDFLDNNNLNLEDKEIHTFLLDEDNKVILVGSPIYNDKMWKLYKKTIDSLIKM